MERLCSQVPKVRLYGTFQTQISQCDMADLCCMTSDWTMHVTPVSVTTFTFLSASYEVRVLILLVKGKGIP